MNKKSILLYFIGAIIFGIFFGYSIVFSSQSIFENIHSSFILSKNIYPDSLELKDTKISFYSPYDISDYKIVSSCNINSSFITKYKNNYFYNLRVFDTKCSDKYFYLESSDGKRQATLKLNIISEYDIYSNLIDYSSSNLQKVKKSLEEKIQKLNKYNITYNLDSNINYYDYIKNNRKLKELKYNFLVLSNILKSREKKYLIPVEGKKLPSLESKLPNSLRPYRSSYTDGIHHAWDFDGDFGEKVVSLDDGIIVRVVNNFNFSNLNLINYSNNISDFDKVKNLDILRGNQVWIKTSKGDVAFYSHLNDVFSNIKEGNIIKRGDPIGTIGITGVPDKSYTDYHLHMPIHKNPYNLKKAGKYDYDDYMNWDWYMKGENIENILIKQNNIFE